MLTLTTIRGVGKAGDEEAVYLGNRRVGTFYLFPGRRSGVCWATAGGPRRAAGRAAGWNDARRQAMYAVLRLYFTGGHE